MGKPVIYLKRISMGPLTLPDELKKGEYRPLTEEEVQKLKNTGGSSAEKQKKMLKNTAKNRKTLFTQRVFVCYTPRVAK